MTVAVVQPRPTAYCAVIVNCLVTVADAESVTRRENVCAPAVIAVPVTAPLDRLNPAGRLPADTAQEYGAVPPLAVNVHTPPETAFPTIGFGRAEGVMDS